MIGLQLTVLNAGRRYLGSDNLKGKVFVSSGLGGMSGAQPKAATVSGCIGVIAEVRLDFLLRPARVAETTPNIVSSFSLCLQ